MDLPQDYTERVLATWPGEGEPWLEQLPALLAEARQRWGLSSPETVSPLSYNYVEYVSGPLGERLVLKAGVPREEATMEIAALRHWAGEGAVREVDSDPSGALLLMERAEPGTTLRELEDDEKATRIVAGLIWRLHEKAPDGAPYPTVERWGNGFDRYRAEFGTGGPIDAGLLDEARSLYARLADTQGRRFVLHGDLHHDNVVRAGEEWVALDPKGVTGETAYECGALLRNPDDRVLSAPDPEGVTRERIAIFAAELGLDPGRILDWAFAQAVLSGVWCVEDGQNPEPALEYARLFATMR